MPSRTNFFPHPGPSRTRSLRRGSGSFGHCQRILRESKRSWGRRSLAVLTPSQSERLRANSDPGGNSDALARPEIIKALDISKEQREKIRTLTDRMEKKQFAGSPNLHGLNSRERRQKVIEHMRESHKIQVETTKPILDVLTPDQRAKFDNLQGRKIEVRWSDDELIPQDAEKIIVPPNGCRSKGIGVKASAVRQAELQVLERASLRDSCKEKTSSPKVKTLGYFRLSLRDSGAGGSYWPGFAPGVAGAAD